MKLPSSLKHTFRTLKYRNYRLYFTGQGISLIGTWIQQVALSWLVYKLTYSPLLLGIVGFVGQFPLFILSPFAGVISDNFNKRKLLVLTQILSMIQAFLLAFLVLGHYINIYLVIFLNFFLSCVNALDTPARQSFVIDLVEDKADLSNAIALNSSLFNSSRLIGPSIAGMLISLFGEGMCFLINAVSYLAVIYSLLSLKIKSYVPKKSDKKITEDIKEGFKYAYNFRPILLVLSLLAFVSLIGMPFVVLVPVFVDKILHSGAHTMGFLMGTSGLGALIGAFLLASRKKGFQVQKVIHLGTYVFAAGLITFALSNNIAVSLLGIFLVGLGMVTQMASCNTLIQTIVENSKRGRIMSLYSMAFLGSGPIGSLVIGIVAGKLGVQTTVVISGVLCIIFGFLFQIKMKKYDLSEYFKPNLETKI